MILGLSPPGPVPVAEAGSPHRLTECFSLLPAEARDPGACDPPDTLEHGREPHAHQVSSRAAPTGQGPGAWGHHVPPCEARTILHTSRAESLSPPEPQGAGQGWPQNLPSYSYRATCVPRGSSWALQSPTLLAGLLLGAPKSPKTYLPPSSWGGGSVLGWPRCGHVPGRWVLVLQ